MESTLAIQCLPLSPAGNKQEIFRLVDAAIDTIDKSGLPYTVGPLETVVEGPLEELFALAQNAHQAVLNAGATRVASYMKFFSGPDLGSSEEKVRKYRDRGN